MCNKNFNYYLENLSNEDLAGKVSQTAKTFQSNVLENFNWLSGRQVLLFGDIQSGKTSHMLGLLSWCLDKGFETIVVLTSDNVRLVQQTYERVFKAVTGVLVCDKSSIKDFRINSSRSKPEPVVIVLGKNQSVLNNWISTFQETKSLAGKPILIIDDEADATSLNTQVNQDDISKINAQLTSIRRMATGCIYLQVTGTPQAILLQSEQSGWSAQDSIYFEPGSSYVGGDFFWGQPGDPHTVEFPDDEDDSSPCLKDAIQTHLLTSSFFKKLGRRSCNMVVHPSHRQHIHSEFEKKIKESVTETFDTLDSAETQNDLKKHYDQLLQTYSDAPSFSETIETLRGMRNEFRCYSVNSDSDAEEEDWAEGFNFIVGGNSLGRGLTFGSLQTVYYSRESKSPQADTIWQHARMFGYDRHKPTLRLFLPVNLSKTFSEIYKSSEILKQGLQENIPISEMRVHLKEKISPTRPTVLDRKHVGQLKYGVNYFAENPEIQKFEELDELLLKFIEENGDNILVDHRAVLTILDYFDTRVDDLDLSGFESFLKNCAKEKPWMRTRVILRTGRKVNRGTGVLLSPPDQDLAKQVTDSPLLVLYRIEGVNELARQKGKPQWSRDPIWVPNIKLPEEKSLIWNVNS